MTAAENGGCIRHIFWDCPMAQALWAALKRPWDLEEPWGRDEAGIKQSIFGLDLYAFPGDIWAHMGRVDPNDHIGATIIQDTAKVAWQQHVLVTLASIWRWRHHVVDDRIGWTKDQAVLYHSAALRASLRGLLQRLPVLTHVRDPRRHLLRVLEARLEATPAPNPAPGAGPRHVLFFDGGSRGNPGPGGAGAVIARVDEDALCAEIVWSAAMSYAHPSTTNNRAEYLGLIAGLKAAKRHGWKVEVVGDSALILRQLRLYRPPKHPRLFPLYAVARRLADELKVREWHHHLRAFNKMADHMANVAMDLKRSIQALHTHQWPHHEQLHRLLATDFQEWQSRYLLRDSQRLETGS